MARQWRPSVRFCHAVTAAPGAVFRKNRGTDPSLDSLTTGTRNAYANARYGRKGGTIHEPLTQATENVMNLSHHPDFPPPDFVAFLAQRSGLTQEAAEDRLACWLGEYHATAGKRSDSRRTSHASSLSL